MRLQIFYPVLTTEQVKTIKRLAKEWKVPTPLVLAKCFDHLPKNPPENSKW